MSIVSYAQNFEDVMLWRALSHIEQGFYIDIGAQDPLTDSVSLAFYERGWRGIHVEPIPLYAEALRQARPGDTVIQAAVGSGPALLPFFAIPGGGLSTASLNVAEQHLKRGIEMNEITVPCIPLSEILETHASQDVHWLKIDVEGLECAVIESWGTAKARPWIVIIESTYPLTQIESHQDWEARLLAYGYSQEYFDGLHRYYVSEHHQELVGAFRAPPNVFDDFTLNGTSSAPFHKLIKDRYEWRIKEIQERSQEREDCLNQKINQLAADFDRQLVIYHEQTLKSARALQATQQAFATQQEAQTLREEAWLAKADTSHREYQDLLVYVAQREREVTSRFNALQLQHAEKERVLSTQLRTAEKKLHALESDFLELQRIHNDELWHEKSQLNAVAQQLTDRGREIDSLQLSISQQAREHSEKLLELELDLRQAHATREQQSAQKLNEALQELNALQGNFSQRERELMDTVTTLEHEITQLNAKQEQCIALYEAELAEKVAQQQSAQKYETYVADLREQLVAEKAWAHGLTEAIAELNAEVQDIRSSRVWRLISPLRRVASSAPQRYKTTAVERVPDLESGSRVTGEAPTSSNALSPRPQQLTPHSIIRETVSRAVTATENKVVSESYDLHDLLAADGAAFVNQAYRVLLRREPDSSGFSYYATRIKSGDSKIVILGDIRYSEEGRANAVQVKKLRPALFRLWLSRVPLVGRLIAPP